MSFKAYFPVTDEEAARICAAGQQETGQVTAATVPALNALLDKEGNP